MEETWLKFKLLQRPYYDRQGNILERIEDRRNRKGIDEFSGGGKVYPSIVTQNAKILEWHEQGDMLLLKVDMPALEAKAETLVDKELAFQASPKVTQKYRTTDFQATILPDLEAENLKETVFGIINPVSGVTESP